MNIDRKYYIRGDKSVERKKANEDDEAVRVCLWCGKEKLILLHILTGDV